MSLHLGKANATLNVVIQGKIHGENVYRIVPENWHQSLRDELRLGLGLGLEFLLPSFWNGLSGSGKMICRN